MTEPEGVSNTHSQEDAPLVVPESRKNRLRLLRLLSFVLSHRGYSNVTKILKKVGLGLPTKEEFRFASRSKPHDHKTALRAMWCLHDECLPETSRTGIMDFLAVYAVSTFIDILMQLSARRRKSFMQIISHIPNASSTRFALSVSSFFVIYKTLLRFFTRVFDPLFSTRNNMNVNDIVFSPLIPPFLAGLLAGPSLLIDKDQSRRISISVYILSKSLQFVYHALRKDGIIPVMSWWWGSWLIFPICSSQLIYAYLVHPDIFPSAYDRFITSRSSTYIQQRPEYFPLSVPWPTGREIVDRIVTLSSLNYPEFYSPKLHGREVSALPDTLKPIRPILEIAHPAHSRMMCALLHPKDPSCLATYFKFIAKEGVAALKFMGSVHILSLIFKWKTLVIRPNEVLIQFLNRGTQSIFKGATFITMAIATAWALICGLQNVLPNKFMPVSRICINGFISGLWILVEDQSRRLDIGMYSLRLSIESFWKLLVKKGKVKNIRNGEAIYFSLAIACIMAIHKTQSKSISTPYFRYILNRLLGGSQ